MYQPRESRYQSMSYARCGRSGLQLPRLSLGLWHNFGTDVPFERQREMVLRSFDCGITHFDLANMYGSPPGAAEQCLGRILATDLAAHRDELVIGTKAGFPMWPGPHGEGGSRKSLLASLDQSLERLGLEYVDIFYSHRYDPSTALEETLSALDAAVRQGKALYVGISQYGPSETRAALTILRALRTPFIVHQPPYSMIDRRSEGELLRLLEQEGIGCVVFSVLAQGLLTSNYLSGERNSRRFARSALLRGYLANESLLARVCVLERLARERGQSLAQMAIAWVLRNPSVTSALIGASSWTQIEECLGALASPRFSAAEIALIDAHSLESSSVTL